MYAGKRYPLWRTVSWSRKYILLFLFMDSIPVILFHYFDLKWIIVPWQPISLIGIAVSFYLGFKNNSSYERLWEARKIWGGIVNASRSFTVSIRDFVTNEFAVDEATEEELKKTHKTIVHRHIAWLYALTYQLREKRAWENNSSDDKLFRKTAKTLHSVDDFKNLKPYLSDADYSYVMGKGNKASHIISLQSKQLKELKIKGHIDSFRHMELQKLLQEFYTLQGKSERIKNFPFPRQYATVNYIFVWIFLILLPFAMIDVFSHNSFTNFIWLTIPFTMLVSWVFILMEMIGEYSENPFEGLFNDVPITSLSGSIEIDIRQMLEEEDLPEKGGEVDNWEIVM